MFVVILCNMCLFLSKQLLYTFIWCVLIISIHVLFIFSLNAWRLLHFRNWTYEHSGDWRDDSDSLRLISSCIWLLWQRCFISMRKSSKTKIELLSLIVCKSFFKAWSEIIFLLQKRMITISTKIIAVTE